MPERRKILSVQDIPVEMWVKVIVFLMVLISSMMGWFGKKTLDRLDNMGASLTTMSENMAVISGTVGVIDSRSIRNETDIKSMKTDFNIITEKVYTLDGEFKSWKRK